MDTGDDCSKPTEKKCAKNVKGFADDCKSACSEWVPCGEDDACMDTGDCSGAAIGKCTKNTKGFHDMSQNRAARDGKDEARGATSSQVALSGIFTDRQLAQDLHTRATGRERVDLSRT